MMPEQPPVGIDLSTHVEHRPDRRTPYRARVRWIDPASGDRRSLSESFLTPVEANDWIAAMVSASQGGIDPAAATKTLREYGTEIMPLALRGLEAKTLDPYRAGWKLRVLPALGHLQVRQITHGAVDRSIERWVAEGQSLSTVKNSLAVLVRVLEQAVRDGLIDRNPARINGWQRLYSTVEDELEDPRALAIKDWNTLTRLADALVARSMGKYQGWGDITIFAACTAARIGEVSGVRAGDVDLVNWTWTVRRQTTTAPGGLIDKGTKGKRARWVPLIPEVRDLVASRVRAVPSVESRLFTGPRRGRITTAILRDATHWDEVVAELGLEHLRRHDLRHTGLTWMADAGVPVHVLMQIAGHGALTTTQRYIHPIRQHLEDAGSALSAHLRGSSTRGSTR